MQATMGSSARRYYTEMLNDYKSQLDQITEKRAAIAQIEEEINQIKDGLSWVASMLRAMRASNPTLSDLEDVDTPNPKQVEVQSVASQVQTRTENTLELIPDFSNQLHLVEMSTYVPNGNGHVTSGRSFEVGNILVKPKHKPYTPGPPSAWTKAVKHAKPVPPVPEPSEWIFIDMKAAPMAKYKSKNNRPIGFHHWRFKDKHVIGKETLHNTVGAVQLNHSIESRVNVMLKGESTTFMVSTSAKSLDPHICHRCNRAIVTGMVFARENDRPVCANCCPVRIELAVWPEGVV